MDCHPSVAHIEKMSTQTGQATETELERYKRSLAASVKAYKKLQKEKGDLEQSLASEGSLVRSQTIRQQRQDAIDAVNQFVTRKDGPLQPQQQQELLDALRAITFASESAEIIDDLNERLRVAASQKVIVEMRLAQKSAELDDLKEQQTAAADDEGQPVTAPVPVKLHAEADVADIKRLTAELTQARSEAAASKSEVDGLRRQASGFTAALDRLEKLQRDLDQARKNLDSEVQLRRQDNMRQEERVGELSAIIGVHEERLAKENDEKAQLKLEIQRLRGVMSSPSSVVGSPSFSGDGSNGVSEEELAKLVRENKALEEKVKKLKAYVTANKRGTETDLSRLASNGSPSQQEVVLTELNTTVEAQRRQLHAMTDHLDSLRKQLAESRNEAAEARKATQTLQTQLEEEATVHKDEMARVRNDFTAQYGNLDQQFKLLRQRFDDMTSQKDAQVAKLSASLRFQDSLGGLVNHNNVFNSLSDRAAVATPNSSASLTFADEYAAHNEDLLKSTTLAGLEQELGTQSDQIKVLQQTVADYEQQGNNWKALEKLLREEIQRLERMQRRETHNLEYLKNIVLQFVHASAHRRKQLVPVLSTVLELSKEEGRKLESL